MLQGCYPRGGNQLRWTHRYYSKRSLVEVTSSEETISTQLMVANLQPADWIMYETGHRRQLSGLSYPVCSNLRAIVLIYRSM